MNCTHGASKDESNIESHKTPSSDVLLIFVFQVI